MEGTVCGVAVVVGIIAIIAMLSHQFAEKAKIEQLVRNQAIAHHEAACRRAKQAYDAALHRLKSDPANPERKEEALRLGREYARVTREGNRETMFDELSCFNDINAATAAASERPATPSVGSSSLSVEDRLKKLEELRSKELVTQDEYQARREKILDDL